jgi:hypothetical protein
MSGLSVSVSVSVSVSCIVHRVSYHVSWRETLVACCLGVDRNIFSFLSFTLFRPECEVNMSYRARWVLKLSTPAALIYIIVIVWLVHRTVMVVILKAKGKRRTMMVNDKMKTVIVKICAHGQVRTNWCC